MSPLQALLLGLGLLLPTADLPAPYSGPDDPAQLRELLHHNQHPRNQSQAALLLVQSRHPEAEAIVRKGLRQTDAAEVFLALAGAIRLTHDGRFSDELLQGLVSGRPAVRLAASETLAVVNDPAVLLRLQALVENTRSEAEVRQDALRALARSGKKAAVVVLIEQVAGSEEPLRQAAANYLADLTGLSFGTDAARWRSWWQSIKDLANEQWLSERLAYQSSRARRLESDLERARNQVVQLHQQLYQRLSVADRLGHVQTLAEHEDSAVRLLAVNWSTELLAQADAVGQRALGTQLLQLSNDGTLAVQVPATLALGRVNNVHAFEQLGQLLRQEKPPVRAAAAHALTQQALARPAGPEAQPPAAAHNAELVRKVVPLLQKALDDPALEVVVAAAEDLGALGVPEAGPVLAALLRHPSESVRKTAAQALERVANPAILDGLLTALDDPAVTVRFGLVGALGRVAGSSQGLGDAQRSRVMARLEDILLRDPDPGVRSRAATVLGQTGATVELPFLWRRVQSQEDSRVQEKTWTAMIEILARANSLELLRQWDRTLVQANQGPRRLQLLTDVNDRWRKADLNRPLTSGAAELLVQAQLDGGKWAASFPFIRELLERSANPVELDRRLGWLLKVGEQALADGNKAEAQRAVREAQPFLPRSNGRAREFENLDRRAKMKP